MSNKIRVAAIKFAGLSPGGTERCLQTIAANLPKDRFEVDYYYCDAAPYIGSDWKHPDTDIHRVEYMKKKGINCIKFNVGFKNVQTPTHDWVHTDFWKVFDENKYDVIQTARAGHPEYPFYLIKNTPIIDLITLPGMADRNPLVKRVIHISRYQAQTWIAAGGEQQKIEIVPISAEFDDADNWFNSEENLRERLGISEDCFVYGMHQRSDSGIFSSVPLEAYSKIENEKTFFIILGGAKEYSDQAKNLNLKNFIQLSGTGDQNQIASFLKTLDVYAHGRKDGETGGLAIAEGMSLGLPVISHVAPAMGHKETIGDAGFIAKNVSEYAEEMNKLFNNEEYKLDRSKKASERYSKFLSLESNIQKIIEIYDYVIKSKKG